MKGATRETLFRDKYKEKLYPITLNHLCYVHIPKKQVHKTCTIQ